MTNLVYFFIIGIIIIVFTGGIPAFHPEFFSGSSLSTTTMLPASYRQWEFGHCRNPHVLAPMKNSNMMYHYRPFHYTYGERSYGMYRPYGNRPYNYTMYAD